MSKINAIRLINLNYNNNSIRISDETFQMGGKSTLLSLRNGGGKSVLVQMITAPFVHKQYRKTKDRDFESYFTTAKPTFIMVEWQLEKGAGYCLTGMMVRKSQSMEEQSAEPLEIVNFISEYQTRCEHDIYHIPVVEKGKKEIILKNYGACRQIFEEYKKDHTKKFFYYDMNNPAQSRQYFDKLAEYQIYYKEWENIIRKVNFKESGLSELFADCKDEKGLIEKWFLESVERKLDHDKNRMKEFQTIVEKYVGSYKDNKSKIERRDTILKFKEDMQGVEEKATDYLEWEQKVQSQENRIACFKKELELWEEQEKSQKQNLEQEMDDCEQKLAHVIYEKLSMEIHQLIKDKNYHVSNRDMIGFEKDTLETEIEEIEKKLHYFACAKQLLTVQECEQDYRFYQERIAASRMDEKELEPERKQIGGYLKGVYTGRLRQLTGMQEEKTKEREQVIARRQEQREKEQDCQKRIEELIADITACRTRISGFDRKEDIYNRDYREKLTRNIVGDYEPGSLDILREQYEKELAELIRSSIKHKREQEEALEKQHSLERDIEDRKNEEQNLRYELRVLQQEKESFDRETEERRIMMRYLDADESLLWNRELLLEAADRKIAESDRNRRELEKDETLLQQEWKKLTSGEILELPDDFREMLDNLELHPVYGMTWLDKNGYSVEENEKLVRRQPFLPYSLILSGQEIRKLESQGGEICTSFPIPIIPREELETVMTEQDARVVSLSGICFYMWFNEKLLDEEALRSLIVQKENEIKTKQDKIANRRQEYQDYLDKKSVLMRQTVTREKLEQNLENQEQTQEKLVQLAQEISRNKESLTGWKQRVEELDTVLQQEKQKNEWYKRREKDFAQFCLDYEAYEQDRKQEQQSGRDKARYEERKKQAEDVQEKYTEQIKSLEAELEEMSNTVKTLQDKLVKYQDYETEPDYVPGKTAQELEARFKAITTQMSVQLQSLESQLVRAGTNLNRAKEELQKLEHKYRLTRAEWESTIYQEKEESHQEIMLEDRRKKYKGKENLWNEEDKAIGILESRILDKKKGMEEQCGKEEPLPMEEIRTEDFDAIRNQLIFHKTELSNALKTVEKKLQSIGENLTSMSEYQDFVMTEPVEWEEAIQEMDGRQLRKYTGEMRRDYRQNVEERKQKKGRVEMLLNAFLRKEEYQEDYYRKPLEAMLSVTDRANLVLSQLHTTIQSYESQLAKLEVDISVVGKEKLRIEGLLEDYLKEVHMNLAKIDNNSSITIRNRSVKMLKLDLPDWETNEGLYKQRLEDFMTELTQRGIEIYEKNENPSEYFGTRITTKNLYNTVVGTGNIQIKLYKIEEQREYPITWAEVAKNSGGEGFLSAFVILSSLLYYMRRDDTDIFADRNEGKVLVMDNPFAQTSSAHLLKPLMDMAKKNNTQLICLSGLGGDSIYGRFDNIYVLNLVNASLRGDMQYLRADHTRGTEEETMLASRIEVIGQQSLLF